MKNKPDAKRKQTSVVMDAELHNEIKAIAKREHRSVSAQIALFLANAVGRRRTDGGK